MKYYDFICKKCRAIKEVLYEGERVYCECGEEMDKVAVATKSYSMKGNNGGSTTPKKFRTNG